ncbi:diguanylate cyclase [Cohnella sp. LGH]|uniref:Diguanylate cyclase (GGDEF)-like protein n=1 Tax=Cohnella phaseoli TaxID=456490 RepID=A0A3D9KL11_9BACL|nr:MULTISPECIES: sensor domain-containing diguanylate cyclase [Cohnella]QTH46013.1 diguanylate cyclase [Cohnella sp. LGH]RED86273.1 diguanylate cyclase (GGDEF)-like protein [Cohnella phaseoli]
MSGTVYKRNVQQHHETPNVTENPSLTRQQLPQWLQKQELTEADLPYIHDLLASGFAKWLEEAEGFPWLGGPIALLHPDGTNVNTSQPSEESEAELPFWGETGIGPTAASRALDTCRPTLMRAEEHRIAKLKEYDSIAVPIFARTTGFPYAVVACLLPAGTAQAGDLKLLQAAALHIRSCIYRSFENLFVGGLLRERKLSNKEEVRRNTLFGVMRRLNDHIDVESVLSEVLDSLEQLYPVCKADLFLSQDYSSPNEKVRPLAFHLNEMELCKAAFLDGKIREEFSVGRHRAALPLSGKQGVYGVLRLDMPEKQLDEADISFLTMLAGAAGAAFEKAKLHEQANVLVGELRLINELTQRLNSSLKLSETMQFASAELLAIFKSDFCCILQFDTGLQQFMVMSSNVAEMIGETYSKDYGFCGVMWSTQEPIILSDYCSATPVQSKLMDVTDSRSLLASPLLLNGEVIGAVMIAKRESNFFSYDNYKLLQVLSAHLGLAISNATLHAEVRRMVITDNLTGLYARHYLNERIGRKQLKDSSGSLIVVDIDHFKKINDTYGHQVGDDILIQVSQIIRTSIRDSDIAARWGGEELAIYLPLLSLEQTERVAERIRQRVESETNPKVTVSCGISEWRLQDERVSVEMLFYKADMALYEAKHHGRNCIVVG